MTSNFKEFRLESSSNGTWDQQNAVANTAVCPSFYFFFASLCAHMVVLCMFTTKCSFVISMCFCLLAGLHVDVLVEAFCMNLI